MAESVFIDASVWYALIQPRDRNHALARSLWRRMLVDGWTVCTTNWTLYEAADVLAGRDGRHDWACWLLDFAKRATSIADAAEVEGEALLTFRIHVDKRWSIVDCASFHAIRRRGCRRAFAFDEHFRQAQDEFGFKVIS